MDPLLGLLAMTMGLEAKADVSNIRASRKCALGDIDGALAAWAAILAWHPTYLPAYVGRAGRLSKGGDQEAAQAELDRFVALTPTDARGYLARANFFKDQGDEDTSAHLVDEARTIDPDHKALAEWDRRATPGGSPPAPTGAGGAIPDGRSPACGW